MGPSPSSRTTRRRRSTRACRSRRTRLMNQPADKPKIYFNLFDTFAKIATQEGPLARIHPHVGAYRADDDAAAALLREVHETRGHLRNVESSFGRAPRDAGAAVARGCKFCAH